MGIVTYDKLVRSKVPANLKEKGVYHTCRIASPTEHRIKARAKIVEEANEFNKSGAKEELADLLEIIETNIELNGWTKEEIEQIRLEKRKREGDFREPIILMDCEKKPHK